MHNSRSFLTVKPNWIGPKATMRTQKRTETAPSRMTWVEDPMILDCREPILYQLPVWRNGFWRSLASPVSSLKLILNLQPTSSNQWHSKTETNYSRRQKVFAKMSHRGLGCRTLFCCAVVSCDECCRLWRDWETRSVRFGA